MYTYVTKIQISLIHLPACILSMEIQPSTLKGRGYVRTIQWLKGHKKGPMRTTAVCRAYAWSMCQVTQFPFPPYTQPSHWGQD